jgi:hypothetical protein
LQIGRRHWPAGSDNIRRKRTEGLNLGAIDGQRFETFVETIGKDDGLKHLVCLIVYIVLAYRRHGVPPPRFVVALGLALHTSRAQIKSKPTKVNFLET